MALTLSKLAPFLPYGVRVKSHTDHIGLIEELYVPSGSICMEDGFMFSALEFKLICRPWSHLTKEITVEGYNDGKPFVPLTYLSEWDAIDEDYYCEEKGLKSKWIKHGIYYELDIEDGPFYKELITTYQDMFKITQFFYSLHFPVGLDQDDWINIEETP